MPVTSTNLHQAATKVLLRRLPAVWVDENAMSAYWGGTPLGAATPFDRTKNARALVTHLFNDAWADGYIEAYPGATKQQAPRPTSADIRLVGALLAQDCNDYNLLTQVLPNLIPCNFAWSNELEEDLRKLQALFEGTTDTSNPFKAKKAAMDQAWSPERVAAFPTAQSLLKVAKTKAGFTPPSWRITPHGRTPALTDSAGVSGLPAIADKYLSVVPFMGDPTDPKTYRTAYVTWTPNSTSPTVRMTENPAVFLVDDLPEGVDTFTSDSGGAMLGQVMLARGYAFDAWAHWAQVSLDVASMGVSSFYVLTKLYSLRIVGTEPVLLSLEEAFAHRILESPGIGLTWSWGQRGELVVP